MLSRTNCLPSKPLFRVFSLSLAFNLALSRALVRAWRARVPSVLLSLPLTPSSLVRYLLFCLSFIPFSFHLSLDLALALVLSLACELFLYFFWLPLVFSLSLAVCFSLPLPCALSLKQKRDKEMTPDSLYI